MKKYILVGTMIDRFSMLLKLIESINLYLKDFKLILVAQGYNEEVSNYLSTQIKVDYKIIMLPKLVGMHNSKMIGLEYIDKECKDYLVCSSDDDMVFTNKTTFTKSINKLQESNTGMVSLGWVRHINALSKYKVVDEFVKQNIIYTGGGLLFTNKLTQILLQEPRKEYICDNTLWSILSYTNGYNNYRYRGSCTIHNICSVGGRRSWIDGGKTELGRTDLVEFKKSKLSKPNKLDYLIPDSSCITELGHQLHKQNKK